MKGILSLITTSGDEMVEELNRMKSENKKLSDVLTIVTRNYNDLMQTRKRKAVDPGYYNHSCRYYSCCDETSAGTLPKMIKSNVSRVYVRIDPSDTSLVVKDGYGWRKYGQKVTRDNPSPRAYYKCSFTPSLPCQEKVQRSLNDPSLVVATYEGHHHHHHPSQANVSAVSPPGGATGTSTTAARITGERRGSTESLDFLDPLICSKIQKAIAATESSEMQQFLVEKMASSLTRNPAFMAALATAITGGILDEVISEENKDVVSNSRGFSV
ncbi:probable WRKY transcription factor 40 [Sesamum indicum]|uniref:Probable WRKY transcription factor 40 n=1 Tax=Sesamum indicum TaxID=4182 RepID=A0A6I9SKG1_SESIN|nr:probable WRKY transcription factor 40 [Sesamum indicum]